MSAQLIANSNGQYSSMPDTLINYLGDPASMIILSVLIQLHNKFVNQANTDKKEFCGKIYHTHEQLKKRYPWLSSSVITSRIKIIEGKRLMEVRREGNPLKNYFYLNEEKINKIIRSGKQDKSRKTRIDNSRKTRNKINNNTTINNKKLSSKEERVSTDTKKKKLILVSKKKSNPVPDSKAKSYTKIQKKNNIDQSSLNFDSMSASPVKNEYKPKHPYSLSVVTCYNSLLMLGCTKHREGTSAFHKTMDFLYEILNPDKFSPPYCKSKHNISDEYKKKNWTADEIIASFQFYMAHDENKTHKNIKDFILAERFGEKSWSPLIRAHKMVLAASGAEYDGDEKRLFKELERLNFTKGIGPKEIRRIIKLIDLYCADLHVNESLSHIYYGRVVFAFGQFISEKLRQASFKSHYMLSEKVMQEFVDTFSERGVLIQNGYGY